MVNCRVSSMNAFAGAGDEAREMISGGGIGDYGESEGRKEASDEEEVEVLG